MRKRLAFFPGSLHLCITKKHLPSSLLQRYYSGVISKTKSLIQNPTGLTFGATSSHGFWTWQKVLSDLQSSSGRFLAHCSLIFSKTSGGMESWEEPVSMIAGQLVSSPGYCMACPPQFIPYPSRAHVPSQFGKFLKDLRPAAPPTIWEELYPPKRAYGVSPISLDVTLKLTIALSMIPLSLREKR